MQKSEIQRLIFTHTRRLHELKEQKALYGISVDPKIPLEIKGIESEITQLELDLETASDVDDELPPKTSLASSGSGQPPSNNLSGSVQIGHVGGGISNSNIAGGNINITNTKDQTPIDDKKPTFEDLQFLLADIYAALAEISTQKEMLQSVSIMAPFTVMGAKQGVKDAVDSLNKGDMEPKKAKSVVETLDEAAAFLENILDKAITAAQKTDAAGKTAKPLVGKLTPLVKNIGVAVGWITEIWMLG